MIFWGKKGTTAEEKVAGVAFSAVVKLCQNLFGQGYFIFTDTFYTSFKLGKALLNRGLYLIGTVKCNCPLMPQCLRDWKVWEKKARRGDFRWTRHEDDPNFVYNQWKDSKIVRTISAIHSGSAVAHAESCTMTIQESHSGWKKDKSIKCPQVIQDYNYGMLGVDKSNQLLGKYPTYIKTIFHWWKALYFHGLDMLTPTLS